MLSHILPRQELNCNLWKRLIRKETYEKVINIVRADIEQANSLCWRQVAFQYCSSSGKRLLLHEKSLVINSIISDGPNGLCDEHQRAKKSLLRLRYVGRGLKYIYSSFCNLTYMKQRETRADQKNGISNNLRKNSFVVNDGQVKGIISVQEWSS